MPSKTHINTSTHTSIIFWRGKKFEFTEPVNQDDIRQFLAETKGNDHLPRNIKIKIDFHGAKMSQDNYLPDMHNKMNDDVIYYFPNNQMRSPTGLLDKIASTTIRYPSKEDAKKNADDAAKTLGRLCESLCDYEECSSIIPYITSTSAGVNTMLNSVKNFLDICLQDPKSLSHKVYLLKHNIQMACIPTAGYKGASPEDSAETLCEIDKKVAQMPSYHSAIKRWRHGQQTNNIANLVDDDRYNLVIHDNQVLHFRLHHVDYTRQFLQYLNNNNGAIPLNIIRYYQSDNTEMAKMRNNTHCIKDEEQLLNKCKANQFQNLKNIAVIDYNMSHRNRYNAYRIWYSKHDKPIVPSHTPSSKLCCGEHIATDNIITNATNKNTTTLSNTNNSSAVYQLRDAITKNNLQHNDNISKS